ncbi:hypothetical protein KEJ39_06645 [Candidatus Bathyarchaeota archaeon]|nr:hypothetical protein [Candidatus Bathyarchaeota archaeon]
MGKKIEASSLANIKKPQGWQFVPILPGQRIFVVDGKVEAIIMVEQDEEIMALYHGTTPEAAAVF